MITEKVALRPKNEAPRAVLADRRGTKNYLSNDDSVDTQLALRMQRLRLLGIIGSRATLLSQIAWGETAHG